VPELSQNHYDSYGASGATMNFLPPPGNAPLASVLAVTARTNAIIG